MSDQRDDAYQRYLDERKTYIEAKTGVSSSFDRAILSLSGGALALSIVFVKQIAPDPRSTSIPWLMGAWSTFAFAIVLMLSSLFASQLAIQREIDLLDEAQKTQVQDAPESNGWTLATQALN